MITILLYFNTKNSGLISKFEKLDLSGCFNKRTSTCYCVFSHWLWYFIILRIKWILPNDIVINSHFYKEQNVHVSLTTRSVLNLGEVNVCYNILNALNLFLVSLHHIYIYIYIYISIHTHTHKQGSYYLNTVISLF